VRRIVENGQHYVIRHGKRIAVTPVLMPPVTPRKSPVHRVEFVKTPSVWIERLSGQHGRIYDVAMLLLQLDFKNRGRPIALSNEATRHLKLDRRVKYRVLIKLEKLGLISVAQRRGSAPEITIEPQPK
jgi:hypothetical protein